VPVIDQEEERDRRGKKHHHFQKSFQDIQAISTNKQQINPSSSPFSQNWWASLVRKPKKKARLKLKRVKRNGKKFWAFLVPRGTKL